MNAFDQGSGHRKTKPLDQQQDFIENQNHCALCSGQLEIRVSSHRDLHLVREEAYCHRCSIKTRVKDHFIH